MLLFGADFESIYNLHYTKSITLMNMQNMHDLWQERFDHYRTHKLKVPIYLLTSYLLQGNLAKCIPSSMSWRTSTAQIQTGDDFSTERSEELSQKATPHFLCVHIRNRYLYESSLYPGSKIFCQRSSSMYLEQGLMISCSWDSSTKPALSSRTS